MVNEIDLDLYVTLNWDEEGDSAKKHYFAVTAVPIADRYHREQLEKSGITVGEWRSWHAAQYGNQTLPEDLEGPMPAGKISLTEPLVADGLNHVLRCHGGNVLIHFRDGQQGLEREVDIPLKRAPELELPTSDY